MKGVIVQIGEDPQSGRHFGVRAILSESKGLGPDNLGQTIFEVPYQDIDIRDIGEGSPVVFHTEKSGQARIDLPPPVCGGRLESR